jgi:hypothetical protein
LQFGFSGKEAFTLLRACSPSKRSFFAGILILLAFPLADDSKQDNALLALGTGLIASYVAMRLVPKSESDSAVQVSTAVKVLMRIRLFYLSLVGVYAVIGEVMAPQQYKASDSVFFAVLALAVVNVAAIIIWKRRIQGLESAWRGNPDDAQSLYRWRKAYTSIFAYSIGIAFYGFVSRIVGFRLEYVVPFYLTTFLLLLFLRPAS